MSDFRLFCKGFLGAAAGVTLLDWVCDVLLNTADAREFSDIAIVRFYLSFVVAAIIVTFSSRGKA